MKRINSIWLIMVCIVCIGFFGPSAASAAEAYILGVASSINLIDGAQSLKAVNMAVEEINAKGGVNVGGVRRTFRVEPMDIRDGAAGVPASEALLGIEKVILGKKAQSIVVGPYRSEVLMASMDIYAKYKIPMLGTIAMTPASSAKVKKEKEKYKYIFRVGENSRFFVGYLLGVMDFIQKEFGYNKIFFFTQDVMWARLSQKYTTGGLKKRGWTISGAESYPTGATDFSTGLMKARASGAQIICPIFDMTQAGILVKQWKSMKIPALMAGVVSPMGGTQAWKTFDGKIGGTVITLMEIGLIPVPQVPASVRFYDAYKKRWGVEVQSIHGPSAAYEAVYILAEAMERAGSVDSDPIVAELQKTDRMGVLGRARFNEGNQVIYGNDPTKTAVGCMFQWSEKGKRVPVYPTSIATGKIQLPPWMKK